MSSSFTSVDDVRRQFHEATPFHLDESLVTGVGPVASGRGASGGTTRRQRVKGGGFGSAPSRRRTFRSDEPGEERLVARSASEAASKMFYIRMRGKAPGASFVAHAFAPEEIRAEAERSLGALVGEGAVDEAQSAAFLAKLDADVAAGVFGRACYITVTPCETFHKGKTDIPQTFLAVYAPNVRPRPFHVAKGITKQVKTRKVKRP